MAKQRKPLTFGEQLAEARAKAGLTQEQAARLIERPLNTFARWERGVMEPDALMQPIIMAALRRGVRPAEILKGLDASPRQ
jgi:transcriptional regulator with XRE-family HTH domain